MKHSPVLLPGLLPAQEVFVEQEQRCLGWRRARVGTLLGAAATGVLLKKQIIQLRINNDCVAVEFVQLYKYKAVCAQYNF